MSNIEAKIFSSNSLLPVGFLVMASLGNPIQEIPKPNTLSSIEVEYFDTANVFGNLLNQNIKFEQNQIDILSSFVSKLVNESKDLDGEIVDMVNRKFKKLLLKI
jgi:hypothetical protein